MAEALSQTCDVCGARKLETNHWFRIAVIAVRGAERLLIGKWEDSHLPKPHAHVCGASCLAKRVSEFTSGSVNP